MDEHDCLHAIVSTVVLYNKFIHVLFFSFYYDIILLIKNIIIEQIIDIIIVNLDKGNKDKM